MDKENLINEYKLIILDALYENEIINQEVYEKCNPAHIAELPYDGNARTEGKLNRRQEAIEDNIKNEENQINEYDASIKEQKKNNARIDKLD